MEREMDEISLREIIEVIWNGKWIILLVTFFAVATSGIVSFFVLDPVYEARSTVMINNPESDNQLSLQAYKEQVANHAIMSRTISGLNLHDQGITINGLRNKISTEIVKDTNLIRITASDNDPALATNISNAVTSEFVTFMSNQSIEQLKKDLEFNIENINEAIKLNEEDLKDVQSELANTPQILITNKSLSEDAFLHSVVSDRNSTSNAEAGSIQLKDEQLNPLYISLQNNESNLKLEISKLENEKEETQQKINENRLIVKDNLLVVSQAIEPEVPVGPKKLLNVAIAGVVGGMISLFIVFLMEYWRNSATGSSANKTTNDNNPNTSV
jgi:succinoglycan biosynthesis transport protein ExoP